MDLKFTVMIHVGKPVEEVFEAVADPKELSSYFTTGGASGRIEEGATVTWDFHDFPGAFPVEVVLAAAFFLPRRPYPCRGYGRGMARDPRRAPRQLWQLHGLVPDARRTQGVGRAWYQLARGRLQIGARRISPYGWL